MIKRSITVLCTMALCFFVLNGCSTKKSKGSSASTDSVSMGSVGPMELSGDSDSNKAGGIRTIYFDFNSSALSAIGQEILTKNAEILKASSAVKVQIEGHCDERGGVQYNLALGEKRANAVRNFLVSLGVTSDKISTVSLGKERPLSFGHDEDSWSKNRRANFVITAK
jgi:peptidoglycan-associated lipoprotein